MKPFELKQALEQGYAYTRDKKKIVDLKLSDLNVTYRLTGRIEDNPELVKCWTVNGVCNLHYNVELNRKMNDFDLCYLELETLIFVTVGSSIYSRYIDVDKFLEFINLNPDLATQGVLVKICAKDEKAPNVQT